MKNSLIFAPACRRQVRLGQLAQLVQSISIVSAASGFRIPNETKNRAISSVGLEHSDCIASGFRIPNESKKSGN